MGRPKGLKKFKVFKMVEYKNYKIFQPNDDFDISKVWRFGEVCLKPEGGVRTCLIIHRINKLFQQNGVELTSDHLEQLVNFGSDLLSLDMYLKNLFANNGKRIKIKNMCVIEMGKDIEYSKETGMRVVRFIGINPIHEKKSGVEIARMTGDKSKVVLNPNFVK